MSIVQELTLDDVREDLRLVLSILPPNTLHLLEEKQLSYITQDLITAEVRRRTELSTNPQSPMNQLRGAMGL